MVVSGSNLEKLSCHREELVPASFKVPKVYCIRSTSTGRQHFPCHSPSPIAGLAKGTKQGSASTSPIFQKALPWPDCQGSVEFPGERSSLLPSDSSVLLGPSVRWHPSVRPRASLNPPQVGKEPAALLSAGSAVSACEH